MLCLSMVLKTDNVCSCGHEWGQHLINGKLSACVLNQQICDCWNFVAKRIERNEIFDLQIMLNKGGI